jgi:hypothetical protein
VGVRRLRPSGEGGAFVTLKDKDLSFSFREAATSATSGGTMAQGSWGIQDFPGHQPPCTFPISGCSLSPGPGRMELSLESCAFPGTHCSCDYTLELVLSCVVLSLQEFTDSFHTTKKDPQFLVSAFHWLSTMGKSSASPEPHLSRTSASQSTVPVITVSPYILQTCKALCYPMHCLLLLYRLANSYRKL